MQNIGRGFRSPSVVLCFRRTFTSHN